MVGPTGAWRGLRGHWLLTGLAVLCVLTYVAVNVVVGADCLWLVALGDEIRRAGAVPAGIPYAAAPTAGWPNTLVVAELLFSLLHESGVTALAAAQLVADGVALALVAVGAFRAGARDAAVAVTLLLVAAGSLQSLVVVRVQLLSLVPFAMLVLLLRAEHEAPSRRVWLLVPLVAVWSNVHGAALLGVAVIGSYLALSRLRRDPATAVVVGLACLAAVWATPAGLRTGQYYVGVLSNESAAGGTGLWAPPSLANPFDVLLMVSVVTVVLLAVRRRLPLWEYLVLLGLTCATARSARHGVWLLLFSAALAAANATPSGLARRDGTAGERVRLWTLMGVAAVAVAVPVGILATRAESLVPVSASSALVRAVVEVAEGRVVLAPEPLVESLAVAGVRVWVADPLDAFSPADQRAYLDFLTGGPETSVALDHADVVVAASGSVAARLADRSPALEPRTAIGQWRIYVRR